ncbi:patatin-like phospholipase family protein [Macromonas bipunctata]|uniref:patatin-like phospholipase family protein n=1 Tax=Macromonas bipunctata TaxID=183670 RepID=UPI000C34D10F|nr:patatin-like phospholipase family protein [Macromonas bipunctata]
MKTGLVLSGGGAKGAYQVGVLKALDEMGIAIDMVSGASIGALNGAVLVSSPSMKEGIARMEKIWLTLAKFPPLAPNVPAYLYFLAASGLRLNIGGVLGVASHLKKFIRYKPPSYISSFINSLLPFLSVEKSLLSRSPLTDLINEYLNPEMMQKGLPFYISVFKSSGNLEDIASFMMAEFGIKDSPPSEFIQIQSLPPEEQKEALLASAAIPILYAPPQINHSVYHDGGMGGWQKMQGNTPITPLLEAGATTIIVTHLSDGSLWSRHDFPNANIIEIRPQSKIQRSGEIRDILGFNQDNIPTWIEQGYTDTLHCVGRIMEATKTRSGLVASEQALKNSQNSFEQLDNHLLASLKRLTL